MTAATRPKLTRADLTPDQLQHLRTIIHESGHAVAGVLYGGELRSAAVTFGGVAGTQGLTRFHELPDTRHAEVAYSGPWAEARWGAGRTPTQRELHDLFNHGSCADAHVLLAAGGLHTGHFVKPLLERSFPAVLTVARKLHRDGEVFHTDVLAALGVGDGGGPTSFELASIRSSCRRVPPTSAPI